MRSYFVFIWTQFESDLLLTNWLHYQTSGHYAVATAIQIRRGFAFLFELFLQFCDFFVKGLHERFLDLYLLVLLFDGFVDCLLFLPLQEAKLDVFALYLLLLKINFPVKGIYFFVKSDLSLLSRMEGYLFHPFHLLSQLLLFLRLHAVDLHVHGISQFFEILPFPFQFIPCSP